MASSNYEVVVIGAGIMGSCTAYYLSKVYGEKVLLLDQFDFLHRRGSSHGDSRITRLTYPQDHFTYLMKTSYKLWAEAEQEAATEVFVKTGGLDFAKSDNPQILSLIAAAQKWQTPHQVLTPQEVEIKFPSIKLPDSYTAVYCPDSGVLKATKAVSMFQNLARRYGCKMVDNAKVVAIRKTSSGLFQVETDKGVFGSNKCILVSGAWTQKIIDNVSVAEVPLGLKLPLRPIQTTVAYWAVDDADSFSGVSQRFPVFISYEHGSIYACPGIEFPGLIKVSAHHGPDCDPDRRTFRAGKEDLRGEIQPFLRDFIRGVSADEPVRTESCMYTMAPEENYIIDEVPGAAGLFVGCGFSGHGFKMGPVVGTILAQLAISGKGGHPFPEIANIFEIEA